MEHLTEPLVSFVVTCYNYGRYLEEAIASILRQTIQDFEIIVINDGSTDETAKVARGITDPRVRYIEHETNRNLLFTITEGLTAARGKFVVRMDADDRYRPYFLEETVPILERIPEVGLVYGDIASMDDDGRILDDPWPVLRSHEMHGGRNAQGDEFLAQLEDNVISGAATIGRREVFLQALPFPRLKLEGLVDWYLNLRITRNHEVYYRAKTLGDYRLHGANLHRLPVRDRSWEDTVILILDEMLSGDDRRAEKSAVRNRLYARAYVRAGDQQFWARNYADARRCYLKALQSAPNVVADPGFLRHFAATVVGPSVYERAKWHWKNVSSGGYRIRSRRL